jgi:hypothetical protein
MQRPPKRRLPVPDTPARPGRSRRSDTNEFQEGAGRPQAGSSFGGTRAPRFRSRAVGGGGIASLDTPLERAVAGALRTGCR